VPPRLASRPALAGSGAVRAGIGLALLARPEVLPRAMGVDAVTARRVGWLAAMVGARDLVLGAGLVVAAWRRRDPRSWLLALAVADAADAAVLAAAVATRRANPVSGLIGAGLGAAGAAAEAAALRGLS
jgi:hypothetical protein